MSQLGHQLPRGSIRGAAALPLKADTKAEGWGVGFGPIMCVATSPSLTMKVPVTLTPIPPPSSTVDARDRSITTAYP